MSAPLSAVKSWARGKKGENAGKDLLLGVGGRQENDKEGGGEVVICME